MPIRAYCDQGQQIQKESCNRGRYSSHRSAGLEWMQKQRMSLNIDTSAINQIS